MHEALVKNTIIGAAVYGTYEKVIEEYMDSSSNVERMTQNETKNPSWIKEDAYSRASVMQHFGAGLCAGTVHGLFTTALESTSYLYHQRMYLQNSITNNRSHNTIKSRMKQKVKQSIPWTVTYTLHHAIAHSILFASYECSKRLLNFDFQGSETTSIQSEENEDSIIPSSAKNIMFIGAAGGIAGQIQHVVSHYSEQILNVSEEGQMRKGVEPISSVRAIIKHCRLQPPKAPTIGPVMVAFVPSAVGFVAFEFGKEIL